MLFLKLRKNGKERRIKKSRKRFILYSLKIYFDGELPLSIKDFIQKYLYIGKKRIGYITGTNLFNRYGLTTQLSNVMEIATNTRKNPREYEGIKIKFIQNKAPITEENINLLKF